MQEGLPAGLPQPSAIQQWNSEAHCQMGCVSDQEADSQQDALSAAHVRASCVGPVWHGAQRDTSQLPGSVDECQLSDPKELTWEGPMHAAPGNGQAASGSGVVCG